ncbi:small ribosomal subunit Rsm22 family protein [Bradyrhizobium erythrophlei]|uniref:Ribosomal protein RSM22 (Predicted rRNA methylase) n=1 Tax=Bradyrhizobium erythrophlei TaxID=1437360 RepID=A0A1M7T833_9BRAD|nr:small ribosomal subunit Rsm22 family protein [Bradyrhizobium erythrophlei]SHN66868.1 Ribosomal protein RSM22 (predicted rRNA methylase) [Bradyrhizobium erythrophlei]
MIRPTLPSALRTALDAKLESLPRDDIAARAGQISKTYRNSGNSRAIASPADALAYALVRMPATYAAVTACLNALVEARPGFAPDSLLDVGAGPGTASWAAAGNFVSLKNFMLLDINAALQKLALDLGREHSRLSAMTCRRDAGALDEVEPADLVIASYLIGEVGENERRTLAEHLWTKTRDTLLVVEPGTPAGYARIIELRSDLIAKGAHVAAPCPHDQPCPLLAPDWCHFAQRLPRLRAHIQLKGAELPFEDEKFSYVVLTREPPAKRFARVLAPPAVGKVEVAAKLCTADGVEIAKVPRRDKTAYANARRWRWGDAPTK